MDRRINRLEGAGEPGDHIWLRYGTQFTLNGRTHTIEMSVPMPIGADEETREQLLREADAGMNQLSEHVENRVAQMLQRVQPTQGKIPSPTPIARSSPRPASTPAPQTGPQPLQTVPVRTRDGKAEPVAPAARTREREAEPAPAQNAVAAAPPPRSDISVSMPSIPTGDNLSLQQFIGYIRENLGLNPKQAMDILKIKTLSGINLREALEQLQKIAGEEAPSTTGAQSKAPENAPRPGSNSVPVPERNPPAPPPARNPARGPMPGGERSVRGGLNEGSPAYAFDEEIGPEEDEELEDLEDLDLPRELSAQERVQARNKLDSLHEMNGATAVSAERLRALHNVVESQLSPQQLQELIEGVWNITSVKRLKIEQAEALISWAKEDDFVSEVEAVLAILEEE